MSSFSERVVSAAPWPATSRRISGCSFTRKGISPPEAIGRTPGGWDFIRAELAKRNVVFREA